MGPDVTHSGIFILQGLPLPPTDNHLFINVKWGGRVKGPGYRKYCVNFEAWRLQNLRSLSPLRIALKTPKRLQVEFSAFFLRSALYCKDGAVKRLDIQNRLKCICDLLGAAIGIDDRYFFRVSIEKFIGSKESLDVTVKILDEL